MYPNSKQPKSSTMDNCILTCAMIKDGRGYNDGEIVFLTQLVHLPPNLVQLYYSHSIKIINKIKELNLDNEITWRSIYDNHVKEIMILIRNKNFSLVVGQIQKMILELEQTYGVN